MLKIDFELIILFALIKTTLLQYQGIYCDQFQIQGKLKSIYEGQLFEQEECNLFTYPVEDPFIPITITFHWEISTLTTNFRPIIIATYGDLPTTFSTIDELINLKNELNCYLDLVSITVQYPYQYILAPPNYNLPNLQIGIYNYGVSKPYFAYRILIKENEYLNCLDSCSYNGNCVEGNCACNTYFFGVDCFFGTFFVYSQDLEIKMINSSKEFKMNLSSNSWLFIGAYKTYLKVPKQLKLNTQLTDFTISKGNTSVLVAYVDHFKDQSLPPNLEEYFTTIKSGLIGYKQTISSINFTNFQVLPNLNDSYTNILGVFNPNLYPLTINITITDDQSESGGNNLILVGQIIAYVIFSLIMLALTIYVTKKMSCCKKLNESELEVEANSISQNNIQRESIENQRNTVENFLQRRRELTGQLPQNRTILLTPQQLQIFIPEEIYGSVKDNYYWEGALPDECCICLEQIFNHEKCRILYCFHIFHQVCFDSWMQQHNVNNNQQFQWQDLPVLPYETRF